MSLETATQTVKDAQEIKARLQVLDATLPVITVEDIKKANRKERLAEKGVWTGFGLLAACFYLYVFLKP